MKDKITWVDRRRDPETIAAIERNGFGDPVPVQANENGYWVLSESLEQYRERQRLQATDRSERS